MIKIVATTPNGTKINAHVITSIGNVHICYEQNRLFTIYETNELIDGEWITDIYFGEVLIEHCIVPELDNSGR